MYVRPILRTYEGMLTERTPPVFPRFQVIAVRRLHTEITTNIGTCEVYLCLSDCRCIIEDPYLI